MGQPSAKIAYGKNLITPETVSAGPENIANGSQHLRWRAENATWRTMFNDTSSLLAHLATRRSGKARDMIAPGPDAATLRDIIALALRTPDHGKLAPWRFVLLEGEAGSMDGGEAFGLRYRSACIVSSVSAFQPSKSSSLMPSSIERIG